jgi:uncharacterized membrane protein HdeD (DUF308 family)
VWPRTEAYPGGRVNRTGRIAREGGVMILVPPVAEAGEAIRESSRHWWLFLIAGVAWLIIGWSILTPDITSLETISVLAGLVLLFAAANELAALFAMRGWRWLHALFAALFFVGGVYALIRPLETFLALAALIGWFLLFSGTFKIVNALALRDVLPLWWVGLVAGIIEVLIGFWAAGYPGRSIYLLVIWVGIMALMRGVTEIVLAFELRKLRDVLPPDRSRIPAG